MPIGNSDGEYFEDYQKYSYHLPEENQDKNLSQNGIKQPLRVTITPHMQAGESEQGSPEGVVQMAGGPKSLHDMAEEDQYDHVFPDTPEGWQSFRNHPQGDNWERIDKLKSGKYGVRFFRVPAGEQKDDPTPVGQLDEPKTMHFIRHGATPENADNTIRDKGTELTDEGRGQAAEAGRQLKEKGVNAIVSSTLPRAMETAHIIASKLGINPQFDPRLNTWGMGSLEGQPCDKENLQTIKDHVAKTPDRPLGGEESFNDFKDRTFAGIRDAILNNKDKELGIVTHSKTEGALKSWEATGQDNPDIDPEVVNATPDKPGSIEKFTMQPDSTIMQPATYSKKQFAGGPGPTPQSDTPLSRYAQYAGKNTAQALKDMADPYQFMPSPGNLGAAGLLGMAGRIKVIPRKAGTEWDPGPHGFDIMRNTEQGERKIGVVDTYYNSPEKDVRIGWISTTEPTSTARGSEARRLNPHSNALSRSEILDLMREIAREFPEAETVSGYRISGLHSQQLNATQTIPIPKRFREAAKEKYVPQAAWEPELLDVAKERLSEHKAHQERMLSDELLPADFENYIRSPSEFDFPEVSVGGGHPRDLDQVPWHNPTDISIENDVQDLRRMYPDAEVHSYEEWGEEGENPYMVFTRVARENNSHTILVGINGIDHAIGDRRLRTHSRNIMTGELSPYESSHNITHQDEFHRQLRERERPSR